MSKGSRDAAPPVVVGVTGHRNIASNNKRLSNIVAKELRAVVRRHKGAPIIILSGLAEGADRLVADVARETLGAGLWAVLPLPDRLYLRDFATAGSIAEYKALKAASQRVIEAPLMGTRRSLARYGEPRNHQYAWIGAFIAKRAQVLIALWDGAPGRGTGGTAHVVDWFLAGSTPRGYRISRAPRVEPRAGVARTLLHINPETHKVARIARRAPSGARR